MNTLATIWMCIIAFGVLMYVVLDGFALGAGIIMPFIKSDYDRDIMISSILPVWDGNETWLVLGGASLYGAFPVAFSTLLPILYVPLLAMTVALLFRGITFEFRLKARKSKKIWELLFFIGSTVAAFVQGLVLGSFIQGYHITAVGTGGGHQWWTGFSIFCGFAVVFGYALLGSNRLIRKTSGELQQRFYKKSFFLQFFIFAFAIAASIWSPLLDPWIKARWFGPQYIGYLSILPIFGIFCVLLQFWGIWKKHHHTPYWASIGIFIACYAGFIVSCFPYLVPRHFTFWECAAPHNTLTFMLIGAVIMLPILLYYTFYSYVIFRGKVKEKIEY